MALPPDFPTSPHVVLDPAQRWLPDAPRLDGTANQLQLPPLVSELRLKVKEFRDSAYSSASATSRALLHWWFVEEQLLPDEAGLLTPFEYFFAQRKALETIIYLVDVVNAKGKEDLLRFDSSGELSANFFDES